MNLKTLLMLVAVVALTIPAWSDDEAEAEKPAAESEKTDAEAEAKTDDADLSPEEKALREKKKNQPKATFTTLPLCRRCEGIVEVKVPNGEWVAAEEGRFYPLGTEYRTKKGGALTLAFGRDSFAKIEGDAAFGTRVEKLGVKSRTVILQSGRLMLDMPDNLPENAFYVTCPGFTVCDLAGESRYDYEDKGDGELVAVRCITGSISIKGRHFTIPVMRAANEVEIRTSHDLLFTSLYGKSGDYMVHLDRGERIKEELDDNGRMKTTIEQLESDWKLSPTTKVVIRRAVPAIGERMSVFMMCFDTLGNVKSQCSYSERRGEINSGEMIRKEKSNEELAKRAAEAAKTTDSAAATTTEESSDEEEKKEDEKKEESKSEDDE